jgi:transposase
MRWFAGLDWGCERHAVCVVDAEGKVAAHFEITHNAAGLTELRARLAEVAAAAEIPIAIERPSGLIVDTLVEAGHVVVPIHPNVVKACRPRYRAAGGKDDMGDAYLLADVLRTDGHRFRPLKPQSDALKALRAMVRTRDDLVAERVALANQLRALLESFWPGAAVMFFAVDSPIALAFVQRYPTPKSAAKLGPKRLAAFLAQHQYCKKRGPTELLERLRAAPPGLARGAEASAKGELVRALARILQTLVTEIGSLTRRIEHEVEQFADGRIVMSFPRAGRLNAAQIFVELGEVRERFQTEDQLAAEAGVCPVTHASGKSRGVSFRWACNKRLRNALCGWANNSRRSSPWAQDIYARARARGCDHPHATRILTRAWLRVLWRSWTSGSCYDPAQHGGAKKFLAAA